MRIAKQKSWSANIASFLIGAVSETANAGVDYIQGHINDVTFTGEDVLIRIDAGLPDNCANTSYGWMQAPSAYKPIISFVLGLRLRGDSSQTLVVVYTQGVVGGYCRITQIDPEG